MNPRRRPRQNPRPTRHPSLHPNLHRSPLQSRSRKPPPNRPPASAPAENPDYPSAAGLNTQTLEAFGSDYTLTLNVTCPDQGWYKSVSPRFADIKLFPTNDPSHIFSGDPRITFELQSGLDKINYYYDKFENVEELTPRTIGGVEMAGRTYKNVGMWWTEYYGEMPTGGWLAIKISGVDIDPRHRGRHHSEQRHLWLNTGSLPHSQPKGG